MPIQFQCPHCQHAMQLPDTAAGKQGKCPKCSQAVTVPAAGAGSAVPPEDEEFWSELDTTKQTAPVEEEAPKAEKKSDAQVLKHMLGKAEKAKKVKRIGVPWERPNEGGVFERYWDTAIGVMNHATETFAEMRLTGGIGAPFRFLLLGAVLGSLIAAVYGAIGNTINTVAISGAASQAAEEAQESGDEEQAANAEAVGTVVTAALAVMILIAFAGTFFGGIIGGIIHCFLQAALLHLALLAAGVKKPSFETNFRVVAYTNGSILLWNIVPVLGSLFMLFLWFNGLIHGLASTYEINPGKAGLAVAILFIPLVLPFLGLAGMVVMMLM